MSIRITKRWLMQAATWTMFIALSALPMGCGKKAAQGPPPPPKVTVAQPVLRPVTDYLELTGNTQAINTVQLVARVAGYLDKVFFRDGQMVRKGQRLFLIQQNTYQNALAQSDAQIALYDTQLAYAEKELVRYSNLVQQKATSQENVDNWRNQRDSARANLKNAIAARGLAKLNLSYTEITAPFNGRIDRRLQDPGNLVGAGTNSPLAQLNQIDPLYVYFTVSDADLARLTQVAHELPGFGKAKEWPVYFGTVNEESYPYRGRLDFASISLTPTTGTLLMRGIFPNKNGHILPGLFARVRVPVQRKDYLLVPAAAVGNDQQGAYLLIVNERNIVERRSIKTGPLVSDNVRAIAAGLNGKEWVIVEGLMKAAPGRQVTPERTNIEMKRNL